MSVGTESRLPSPLTVPPVPGAAYRATDALNPALAAELANGRNVVWGARFSGNGGVTARRTCIFDAQQGADDLAGFGLDLRHLLPSESELDSMLRSARNLSSVDAKTGRRFQNRFVELWLTPQVLLILSTGTGSRIDEQDLAQPFLTYLSDTVKRTRPVLLFAKRFDRLGRRTWGLGASLDAMKAQQPCFVGDQNEIMLLNESAEARIFLESSRAEAFAATIPKQTRRGMRSRTGSEMVDGQVDYGLAALPPPGLARITMLGSGLGANGRKVMCFESPEWLPPKETVALGYPEVIDPNTGLVRDQVANVRWALERLADPTWSMEAIGEGLIARQFSHTKIRELRGPSGTVQPQMKQLSKDRYGYPAKNIPDSIVRNLDVYETGILRRTMGVEGVEDVVITNVIPPDGRPWATQETFDRIRARISGQRTAWNSRRGLTFGGLPVTVDGQPAVLRTVSVDKRWAGCGESRKYGIHEAEFQQSARAGVLIPHDGLAQVIAEALDRAVALELPLPLMQLPNVIHDEVEKAEHQLTNAEARLTDSRARGDLIYQRVNNTSTTGALLNRLQDEYNTLMQVTIPALEREMDLAKERVTRLREEAIASKGCPTEQLGQIIKSLADPTDRTYATEIFRLIDTLSIDLERVDYGHLKGWKAHTTVTLALTDDHGRTYTLEYQGCIPIAGPKTRAKIAQDFVAATLNGTRTKRRMSSMGPAAIADELGLRGRQAHVTGITDPRLFGMALEIATRMNAGMPTEEIVTSVSADLDEPPVLVRRLIGMYAPEAVGRDPRWWKSRLSWTARPAVPCTHCGAPAICGSLIAEIRVGVCPTCRLDVDGVAWGPEYDQYLFWQTVDGPRTLTGEAPVWGKRKGREYVAWPTV